jgi:hypothetical protein
VNRRIWTNDEINLLKKLKNDGLAYKEIQTYFPNRTLKAIESKSLKLSMNSPVYIQKEDYTGKKFGKWNVIGLSNKKRQKRYLWDCVCDCQIKKSEDEREHHYISSYDLRHGKTNQCRRCSNRSRVKENHYEDKDDYMVGYTSNGEEFYFDKDDYLKINKYCWHKSSDGYIRTVSKNNPTKKLLLHRLILFGIEQKETLSNEVDHINGIKYDNRKSNLRSVCHADNMKNNPLNKNNKSGCSGVYYSAKRCRWIASIMVNGKSIYLGSYKGKDNAINARKQAEKTYFGDFARKAEYKNNKIPKKKKVG